MSNVPSELRDDIPTFDNRQTTKDHGPIDWTGLTSVRMARSAMEIGTIGGLARFSSETLTAYAEMSGSYVRSIHEDSEGDLWIGTYDGGREKSPAAIWLVDRSPVTTEMRVPSLPSPSPGSREISAPLFETATSIRPS